jgi:hypothetical protein
MFMQGACFFGKKINRPWVYRVFKKQNFFEG